MKLQKFVTANVIEISPGQTIGAAASARFAMAAEARSADSNKGANAVNAFEAGDPEGGQRT